LSRMTAWLALSLTVMQKNLVSVNDGLMARTVQVSRAPMEWYSIVPFPLDHFFFCFLPPVATGAMFAIVDGWCVDVKVKSKLRGRELRCAKSARARGTLGNIT
jgi:hypothetical protein